MALRQIRVYGDPILTKTSKEVKEMTPRLKAVIDDMTETMYSAQGVGLAAVQVGILKRIVVIDCGMDEPQLYVMINPVVTETSGEQTGQEGCLSVPGKYGIVTRPMNVTVEYLDGDMQPQRLEAEGLLARAVMHECEHLDGEMYVRLVQDGLHDVAADDEEEEYEDGGEA